MLAIEGTTIKSNRSIIIISFNVNNVKHENCLAVYFP